MYAVCAQCMLSAHWLQTPCWEIQNTERQKGSRTTEAFIGAPLGWHAIDLGKQHQLPNLKMCSLFHITHLSPDLLNVVLCSLSSWKLWTCKIGLVKVLCQRQAVQHCLSLQDLELLSSVISKQGVRVIVRWSSGRSQVILQWCAVPLY